MNATPRILVAFYSRTGVTRQVASKLGADILAILDLRSREDMLGGAKHARACLLRSTEH